MRFTSAAVAAVLVAASVPSYTESFAVRPTFTGPTTTSPGLNLLPTSGQQQPVSHRTSTSYLQFGGGMSGGVEELMEYAENPAQSPLEKQVRKSPSFWKMAGYATIPVSAVLGFGLVPSRRLAAHAAGAIVTGVAGAIGKSRLDAVAEDAAQPAIAQAIIDYGIDDPAVTSGYINEIKELYGIVDDVDFQMMCADVYSKYLLGMVKHNPIPKTSEIKELQKLKTALGLDNLLAGEAHAAAAQEWYRTTILFTPEEDLDDPEHPDRQAMDKFLFLTERTLKQGGETDEAFKFEMTRVAKAMNLSLLAALDRVSEVQDPFYRRALRSTRSKLGTDQVSSSMLERARQSLGIEEQTAFDMHVACYNEEVREQLGLTVTDEDDDDDDEEVEAEVDLSTAKFSEGATEKLEQLREILGLSEDDAAYEMAAEATPMYQATALAAMKVVLNGTSSPDEAWSKIEARRAELLLTEAKGQELLSSMVMQALGGPLEETNKFAKVNNEAAVYDNLLEALEAKKALIDILAKSGWDAFDDFDKAFCDPWDRQSANGFLRSDERIKLYSIFLNRSVRKAIEAGLDGKITDEMYAKVMDVKGLLGISDDQAEIEARAAFGPELQKVCLKALDEIVQDYTPELAKNMGKQINDVMENYRLSEDYLKEQGASYYAKAVSLISDKAPAGIPSDELNEALDALREMLRLTKEDARPANLEAFGPVYKKSIIEAMGSTGVIKEEFKKALGDLRERLGVTEEDTKELFLEAIEEKFVPMVEWINSEVERTQLTQKQLSDRRGKDMGEDVFQTGKSADGTLGLGSEVNVMGDIINLVDFYSENNIAEEKEIGTQEVDGEEVPVVETSYPITAIGSGAIDQEMSEFLYRQFIVGAFQAQGEQANRYESARATFGGILGLTSEKMEDINDNIGSTVYDNFVSRSMATKGSLDQQDMMFLANIQTKLGLTSEQGEKLLMQSQKKVLSEEINNLMDDPSPEKLKAFREKCNMMGMDLSEDVGVSGHRLVRMFESEITPGLKSGEVNADNSDVLTEIQESLNMDPEECETVFQNTVLRLAKQAMDLMNSELLRGRDEMTVDLIKELVRYAAFVDGELDLTVDEATAYKVFNIYEAFDFSAEDPEKVEESKELLKVALGISGN